MGERMGDRERLFANTGGRAAGRRGEPSVNVQQRRSNNAFHLSRSFIAPRVRPALLALKDGLVGLVGRSVADDIFPYPPDGLR